MQYRCHQERPTLILHSESHATAAVCPTPVNMAEIYCITSRAWRTGCWCSFFMPNTKSIMMLLLSNKQLFLRRTSNPFSARPFIHLEHSNSRVPDAAWLNWIQQQLVQHHGFPHKQNSCQTSWIYQIFPAWYRHPLYKKSINQHCNIISDLKNLFKD